MQNPTKTTTNVARLGIQSSGATAGNGELVIRAISPGAIKTASTANESHECRSGRSGELELFERRPESECSADIKFPTQR